MGADWVSWGVGTHQGGAGAGEVRPLRTSQAAPSSQAVGVACSCLAVVEGACRACQVGLASCRVGLASCRAALVACRVGEGDLPMWTLVALMVLALEGPWPESLEAPLGSACLK